MFEEEIITEMMNFDYITYIPPKRKYKIELNIKKIRKAYSKISND